LFVGDGLERILIARAASLLAAFLLLATAARADEGMWTFDNFPAAKVNAAYGVDITRAWLDRVRKASVRLSVGCSGSVVSGAGLVLTNNHCVAGCAHDLSAPGQDLFKTGYLAATRPEEKTCPGLQAEILQTITDVTPRMAAAGVGLSGEALVKARNSVASTIEQEACGADLKVHCETVELYHGGQFRLYRYRRYGDVRLVFSPGFEAAFFGGDPDNFNFPRYDLDCAFLRLYEDGRPVAGADHLRWNPAPPTAGQPVFTSGNPGDTFRALTTAQVETQRDLIVPLTMTELSELRGRIIRFTEESADHRRLGDDELFGLENDYKVYFGWLQALDDPGFMAAKRAAEADLRTQAMARLGPALGDPWADLDKVQTAAVALYLPYRFVEHGPIDSRLFDDARILVRAAEERRKPSNQRLPGYADSQLPDLEKQALAPEPIEAPLEQLLLEFWLSKAREYLTADDPNTALLLGRESPETLSARLANTTRLGDPAVRKALWDGGMAAITASDDPMIQYVLRIDPEARRIRAAYEDQVTGPTARAAEAIAKARFAVYGTHLYPDATFTPRLSYGAVAGWTWRGRTVAPVTTFSGLYKRATGQAPFGLDPRWAAAEAKLNPDTVFDFATTNDIVGGNSGSPVIDARAAVIGAAFDGNIHSLGGEYGYDAALNRAVAVSAAAITEALRTVYGADALVKELGEP
jgi:Peptidase S46